MSKLIKNSLGQEATKLLKKMLLDGRFKAGERLVEDRIANELGISRTPLREALHRLAQEGLLDKRRAGGYEVKHLDLIEIEDAINIRSMLESHAASLAAQRANDKQITDLRTNLLLFHEANAINNRENLVRLNTEFHSILREAAHSPLLTQLLAELDGVVERMLRPIISQDEVNWSHEDHVDIFQAIENKDFKAAANAMHQHVQHGKKIILKQITT